MIGAMSLVHPLLNTGVDTCFANPGTNEMHFVAALDATPGMRCVLGLHENVVTGMADGYYRIARKPACCRPMARPCTRFNRFGPRPVSAFRTRRSSSATGKYNILIGEYKTVGATPGATAMSMLDLGNPDLSWVKLANGMGVEAARATTMDECADLMTQSFSRASVPD